MSGELSDLKAWDALLKEMKAGKFKASLHSINRVPIPSEAHIKGTPTCPRLVESGGETPPHHFSKEQRERLAKMLERLHLSVDVLLHDATSQVSASVLEEAHEELRNMGVFAISGAHGFSETGHQWNKIDALQQLIAETEELLRADKGA